jgi:UDP:flavonoid glycosyltransferase YjiC (YdhE family)
MKLGFICLNLPGHLNPMTALARRLQDRNHDVVLRYSSGWRTPTPESERMRRASD